MRDLTDEELEHDTLQLIKSHTECAEFNMHRAHAYEARLEALHAYRTGQEKFSWECLFRREMALDRAEELFTGWR